MSASPLSMRSGAFALAFALLSGCWPTNTEDPKPQVTLRAGVKSLFEGEYRAWEPTAGVDARNPTVVHVGDAVVDGPRVLASVGVNSGHAILVGDATAQSWQWHDLPRLPGAFKMADQGALGLHAAAGRVVVAAFAQVGEDNRVDSSKTVVIDVDPDKGTFLTDPIEPHRQFTAAVRAYGSDLIGLLGWSPWSEDFDMVTGQAKQVGIPPMQSVRCGGRTGSKDGFPFIGFCTPDLATFCRAEQGGSTVTNQCVSTARIPSTFTGPVREWLSAAGVKALFTGEGRTFAADITGGSLRFVDLGPGEPAVNDNRTMLHSRFADLLPIVPKEGPARLVRLLPGDHVEEVKFTMPCVDDTHCGHHFWIDYLLPLGGDEYLVFWGIDRYSGDFESQVSLLVSHETAQKSAPTFEPRPSPPRFPKYPEAQEGTDLERACFRAGACVNVPDPRFVSRCLQDWGTVSDRSPAWDARRARFVAAVTCEDFASAYPIVLVNSTGCTPGCHGDVAVTCRDGGRYATAVDCTAGHGTCDLGRCVLPPPPTVPAGATCNSCTASGDLVTCDAAGVKSATSCTALGFTCATSPGGKAFCATAACGSTDGFQCDGDKSVQCTQGVPAYVTDCTVWGGKCQNGACVGLAKSQCDYAAQCDGTAALYCENGQMHWTDCGDAGLECAKPEQYSDPVCVK